MKRKQSISFVNLVTLAVLLPWAASVLAQDAPNLPERNPWLTNSLFPMSHHNPANTDVSPMAGPAHSQDLTVNDVKTVTTVFTTNPTLRRKGDERTLFLTQPNGIAKVYATGEKFEIVSFLPYPGQEFVDLAKKSTPASIDALVKKVDAARRAHDDAALLASTKSLNDIGFSLRTVANGGYTMVDKDDNHYAVYGGVNLLKTTDDGKPMEPLRVVKTVNITDSLPPELAKSVNRVFALSMTYDGNVVLAAEGMVALLDRDLTMMGYLTFPGEDVDNGIAVDENGTYVVTSEHMYKVVWTGKKLSIDEADGGWISPYDTMDGAKAQALGAASRGSGTTPTLMGFGDDEDKLVVISDAHEDGTNLVAFWRDKIPADFKQMPETKSRRIADQIRIDVSFLTIEASPVVMGYGALVVNATYPEPSPVPADVFGNAMTSGVTRMAPRGMQKFDWNPEQNKWENGWTDMTIDQTDWMVPVVSATSGMTYFANKVGLRYEYVGLEWDTGKMVGRWKMPNDSVLYNGWGGIGYFLDDGDLIYGGYFGVKRVDFTRN